MSVSYKTERLQILSGSNYFTLTVVTGTIPVTTEATGSIARGVDGSLWKSLGGGSWSPIAGLYAPVMSMSPVPSTASIGLNWVNQPTNATLTTGSQGFTIFSPSQGGTNNQAALIMTSPTTPYTIKALLAVVADTQVNAAASFGWCSGSTNAAPNTIIFWAPCNGGNLQVINYNNFTNSFNSTPVNKTGFYGATWWFRLRDDGSSVTASISPSGDDDDWMSLYTSTRAAGFLGPNGYGHITIGAFGLSGQVYTKVLSWIQGT